uniref:NADH-ubiquinone oxidoreductase chain 5 n=1 Tax=Temnopleurus toreumaticus TaxID=161058 RepID=A0A1L6Z757_9ECHN|nr:NADH dehydrogenase subunit 5 [Temnopleurus toreumaticus]APT42107.1 NADH dehydrogenase subunit 5 [Temnopleurus toreumaticus]
MIVNPSLITTTINLTILTILIVSIFFFSKSYQFNTTSTNTQANINPYNINISNKLVSTSNNSGPFAIHTLGFLAIASTISLILSVNTNFSAINISLSLWLSNTPINISLNLLYDQFFTLFLTIALIVTWSIMEFSYYYMSEDPNNTAFFRLLTIFLLNMLVLTCANSLFLLFLGWEGVGFLSFLLISWWTTRNDASSSALEAVIYNRIGDIGLITFMAISAFYCNSWNITEILSLPNEYFHLLPFLLFGLILAAAGKSAQFGLHPWLPAAMEGPTPVSALLHSSTMVVAGVFLLIRSESIFSQFPPAQTVVLILGAITAIFAASTAIGQHDIKKIIAYSTTSQLGLMVVAIGIGQPILAFFHICTHAFFKAMLFLCSGSIIHSLNDEQDLRKMGGLSSLLPVTSACLALGSLALMGTPFLAGFYSKDLILEATSATLLNTLGLLLSMLATLLTAVYSFRIVFFCFLDNASLNSLSPVGEENNNLTNALLRLSIGTIISGWFFSTFIINTPSFNVNFADKTLPLAVTIIGTTALIVSMKFLTSSASNTLPVHTSTMQWFFVDVAHSITLTFSFISSLFFATRTLDRGWQEDIGPKGIANTASYATKTNQTSQTGLIKRYISSSITTIVIILSLSFLLLS